MRRNSQKILRIWVKIHISFVAASLLQRMPASWHEISHVERGPFLDRFGGGALVVIG
jgi:hypothetical protein